MRIRIMLFSSVIFKIYVNKKFNFFLGFFADYFLKIHLHHFSKIKIHKEQWKSMYLLLFLLDDKKIRIRVQIQSRIWIRNTALYITLQMKVLTLLYRVLGLISFTHTLKLCPPLHQLSK
jgi:hypothetical protein